MKYKCAHSPRRDESVPCPLGCNDDVVNATQSPLAEEVLRSDHGSEADTGGSPLVVVPSAQSFDEWYREHCHGLAYDVAHCFYAESLKECWNAAKGSPARTLTDEECSALELAARHFEAYAAKAPRANLPMLLRGIAALRARPVVAESALADELDKLYAEINDEKLGDDWARPIKRAALALRARPVVAAVSPTLAEIARAIQYSDVFSPEKTATQSYNDAAVHVRALYAQSAAVSPTIEQIAETLWIVAGWTAPWDDREGDRRILDGLKKNVLDQAKAVAALYAQATEKP